MTHLLQVKVKALILAEMQAFVQKKRDEEKSAQHKIKNLSDELQRYNIIIYAYNIYIIIYVM